MRVIETSVTIILIVLHCLNHTIIQYVILWNFDCLNLIEKHLNRCNYCSESQCLDWTYRSHMMSVFIFIDTSQYDNNRCVINGNDFNDSTWFIYIIQNYWIVEITLNYFFLVSYNILICSFLCNYASYINLIQLLMINNTSHIVHRKTCITIQ